MDRTSLVGIDYPNLNKEPQPKLRFVWDRNLIVVVLQNRTGTELGCQTSVQECQLLVRLQVSQQKELVQGRELPLQAFGSLRVQGMP